MKTLSIICLALNSLLSFAGPRDIEHRVAVSTNVFVDRMQSAAHIPDYILKRAYCIASTRNVKAGFIFGGEGGTGLVSCRVNGRWSEPSFLNTGGASFGLLIGGQVVDNVLVFMTQYARDLLNGAQFKLGVDVSYAVGPVGDGGGVSLIPNAHILTYAAGTGFYAGMSFDGMFLAHGTKRNALVYGNGVRPGEILVTTGAKAPFVVQPFVDALEKYAD